MDISIFKGAIEFAKDDERRQRKRRRPCLSKTKERGIEDKTKKKKPKPDPWYVQST